jgi:DNA adenine methylase
VPHPRPFIKWPGGKRSSLATILRRLPAQFSGYHEPFLGGGAVFFGLRQSGHTVHADLSDINHRLVVTYQAVRHHVDAVIDIVTDHANLAAEDHYYQARDAFSTETDPVKLAALFIHLNKAGFNGLYRENTSGKFNVAWGGEKPRSQLVDPEALTAASIALQGSRVTCRPFTTTSISSGHLYYFDPPYDRTWTGYHKVGFGDVDQCTVAEFCRRVDAAGGYFMASNADTPFVRELYVGFEIEGSMVARNINRDGSGRGRVGEVLVRNF